MIVEQNQVLKVVPGHEQVKSLILMELNASVSTREIPKQLYKCIADLRNLWQNARFSALPSLMTFPLPILSKRIIVTLLLL